MRASRNRWLAPILVGAAAVPFAGSAEGAPGIDPDCRGRTPTIVAIQGVRTTGTSGADVILGTPVGDVIDGRGGDDWICGGRGNDLLHGDDGRDRLFGEADPDRLLGGAGADYLNGGVDFDIGKGGTGRDTARSIERPSSIP